ncbi:MAG: hypothetical protein NZM00_07635 [Anaerolinea sp.]|nr:hypothetical protein [Anaerolinea sp.]
MMYWNLETEKLRQEQLIREAEQERLARELIQNERPEVFNPALAWVGQRLVDVGMSLVKLAGAPKVQEPDLNFN